MTYLHTNSLILATAKSFIPSPFIEHKKLMTFNFKISLE